MNDRSHTVFVLAALALGVVPLSSHADQTIHVKLSDNMIQLAPGTAKGRAHHVRGEQRSERQYRT